MAGNLLSVSADAKTRKGESKGYLTGVMYLAPHMSGGIGNLCPSASPGCIATCLNTAGRGVFNSVQQGRIRRTQEFGADRDAFMLRLFREIGALVRKAERAGMTPLVRLNGTSDIPWENVPHAGQGSLSIMAVLPEVQFYDYTKHAGRMRAYLAGKLPRNYHLTFSRSECNDTAAHDVLSCGGNVAVVFSTKRGDALPRFWRGHRVLDGDVSDVRTADPRGYVIGLRAKGKARWDTSGFVVVAE